MKVKDFFLHKDEELIECIRESKGEVWAGCCKFAARHGISAGLVYMRFSSSMTPELKKRIAAMRPMENPFAAKLRVARENRLENALVV